jgi:hypothetical protein
MEKINQDQFFAQYPKYSNFDELEKADVLLMPSGGAFSTDQTAIFRDFTKKSDVIFLFYSESQNNLNCCFKNKLELIYDLGAIVSTIAGLVKIYEFLKNKTQNNKFKIKNVVKNGADYYLLEEFEGNIEQYKIVTEERKQQFETLIKK